MPNPDSIKQNWEAVFATRESVRRYASAPDGDPTLSSLYEEIDGKKLDGHQVRFGATDIVSWSRPMMGEGDKTSLRFLRLMAQRLCFAYPTDITRKAVEACDHYLGALEAMERTRELIKDDPDLLALYERRL